MLRSYVLFIHRIIAKKHGNNTIKNKIIPKAHLTTKSAITTCGLYEQIFCPMVICPGSKEHLKVSDMKNSKYQTYEPDN